MLLRISMICSVNYDYFNIMKKIFFLLLLVFIPFFAFAQDDAESIVFSDLEVEGFENLWVKSTLSTTNTDMVYDVVARPKGGKTRFIYSVHKNIQKLFKAIAKKYPDELLNMMGTNNLVFIDFTVNEDGDAILKSVTNGATLGIDTKIAQKILNSCKKWYPSMLNNREVKSDMRLQIDISL